MTKTLIDNLNRKMSDFFKAPKEVEIKKSNLQIIREKDIFNNFVAQLKKSLFQYKQHGEFEKQITNNMVILFDTSNYVRINTANSPLEKDQRMVSAVKVPKNEKHGVEIISHFRTEKHLRKPVKKLQRWLILNEMPNVYIFSGMKSSGDEFIFVCLDKNFNTLYA